MSPSSHSATTTSLLLLAILAPCHHGFMLTQPQSRHLPITTPIHGIPQTTALSAASFLDVVQPKEKRGHGRGNVAPTLSHDPHSSSAVVATSAHSSPVTTKASSSDNRYRISAQASSTSYAEQQRVISSRPEPFQADTGKGWMNMGLYWAVGGMVGLQGDYFGALVADPFFSDAASTAATATTTNALLPQAFCASLVITLLSRWKLDGRYHDYGRSVDWSAIGTFAFANSIFETILFLASYDLGKVAACHLLGVSAGGAAAVAAGIFSFFTYSALIHAQFWLPSVFPQHMKSNSSIEQPFHTHALPYLTAISLSWAWLYESHHAIAGVCVLHFVLDLWAGRTMAINAPWSSSSSSSSLSSED